MWLFVWCVHSTDATYILGTRKTPPSLVACRLDSQWKGVALTNANRQPLRVVPCNHHSALVLSTLAFLVTLEGEPWSSTIASNTTLIHLIPVVPRHQLALWVVPLYWSGHWSCVSYTKHSLISHPDDQRHVRLWVIQASAAILEVSSGHCGEKGWQEEEQQRYWIIVCNMLCSGVATRSQ